MKDISIRKLYRKKRTLPQWLACYIFLMPFCIAFLLELLHLPTAMRYTIDLAWFSVCVFLSTRSKLYIKKKLLPFVAWILVWLLYTMLVYAVNFQSPFYYLWGFRNNFRFYVAFITFAQLLDEEDVACFLKLMDVMFWINAIVMLVQYFGFGYNQDYLGGIFGVERGCNAYSIVFFSVIISKSMLSFMNGQEKTLVCLAKCGASLFLSALAEIKIYFIIFVGICIMAAMFTKFSWRKCLLLVALSIPFMFASSLLAVLFGEGSNLTIKRILELITATGYATAEDLGRFTAIPVISQRILTDLPGRLFGMGLGNCDTSTFEIFNTPFYASYSNWHYTWFSSAFLFLETGAVGLTMYIVFYALCFFRAWKDKKSGEANLLFCQISIIMSVICLVLTFYNSSLRTEVGYIAYFALALPLVQKRKGG